jgi:hypothetical protein
VPVTRLGLHGTSASPFGSFAGKAETIVVRGRVTDRSSALVRATDRSGVLVALTDRSAALARVTLAAEDQIS